jgi:hypothetical protein
VLGVELELTMSFRTITVLLFMLLAFASATAAQERYPALDKEPACQTLVPFRVMFADSPGPITTEQRALMQRVAAVDVAMLPYVNFEAGIPSLVELVKTFKPATVFMGHHDGPGTMLWASNYPPAYAIRRASPNTRTLDVLYRAPVCFNTATKEIVIGW